MAIITTGNPFGATDAVTSTTLNNIANAATFDDPADETSIEVNSSGQLGIKDGGVTKTKIENVANLRVLGNTSGSPTAPQEVEIIDSDTMTGATATNLATSESIKAYVDSNTITQTTGTAPYFGVRAWANYNMSTDTVRASGNIASIVRDTTSTGFAEITFTTPMTSAYYSIQITGEGKTNVQHTVGFISGTPTANGFRVGFFSVQNSANSANPVHCCITVIQ